MSYYTSQISTKMIDPNVFVVNQRCEFQLPKNDYGNRMRLENVGLFGAGTPTYNSYIGALASIKSIRLLNGRDELDACRECNRHLSFKRFAKSSQKNISYNQPAYKHDYAPVFSGNGTGANAANAIRKIQKSMDLGGDANRQIQATESATPKAYLLLSEVLPFLKSVEVLPAELFSQLRVVIEYESDVRNLCSASNATLSTTRPLLSCDVIEDKELVSMMSKELNGATWDCVEHDLVRIPANNADATNVLVSRRLNGFNNKRLMRFYVSKAPSDKRENVVQGTTNVRSGGDFISQALLNEKFQVRINGSNKISRDGADKPTQRLSMLVDAYGECSTYYGSSRHGAAQQGDFTGIEFDSGRNDYYGMYLNDVVKDMEIQITRDTFQTNAAVGFAKPQASGYDVHIFGDVRKALMVNGNQYQVLYA